MCPFPLPRTVSWEWEGTYLWQNGDIQILLTKLKMDQNKATYLPFVLSVAYASIMAPCAVQSNPAQTPSIAPAAMTKFSLA